ncbi:hypothetical protein [Streptomyces zaomyceticus]|uniref:hypothetical protein n=1 Tax=Streptomyces zaomyceticus TaxID=68286 RepID=UPI00379D0FF1
MSTDIPTEPCEDPTETIMAAVAHGMNGNRDTGILLLGTFLKDGPTPTVSMCAALANMVTVATEQQNPGARGTYGLVAYQNNAPINASAMSPGLRFASQFTAAWMNDQPQTAYALFNALCRTGKPDDAKNLADGVHALYDMAVTSTQQWIKKTAT